ncbi:MAG: xanthine dehydrogenase family protein subunit M [Calditrichaeota bacterium]|nr:MAG: xanthine dehydrogenase family protein subunit M [Calditrichota bacterium]
MKPAPFKYLAPTSVEEALFLLARYGDEAKVLAGGQSLVPTMNFRLLQPSILIDLNRVQELFYIRAEKSQQLLIGAMTRQREVERSTRVDKLAPLVTETLPFVAHPQIRNRGTIGGSLAHADPAAELPAVMVALSAKFRLQRQGAQREVPAEDFFLGPFETALQPGELLMEIAIPPLPPRYGWAFREVARRHGDYAMAGLAVVIGLDEAQICKDVRLVYLSMGEGAQRARTAEKLLAGEKLTPKLIHEAAETAADQDLDPPADIHASTEFRRHLAKVLTVQALEQAIKRARSK